MTPSPRLVLCVILMTSFVDAFGTSMIMPITPSLVEHFLGSAGSTGLGLALMISSFSLAQFICAPAMGWLSDRIGRRPVILATLAIAAFEHALSATTTMFSVLIFARFVAGACGGNMMVAYAYLADVTPAEMRTSRYGWMAAALALGIVAGPALGGLVAQYGLRAPFWLAAGLAALNFACALLFLPESRSEPFMKVVKDAGLKPLTLLRTNPVLRSLITVLLLGQLARAAIQTIFVVYTHQRFAWGPIQVGAALTLFGLSVAIAQAALTGLISQRLGDRATLLLGLLLMAGGLLSFCVIDAPWQVYLAVIIFSFGMIYEPAAQGLLSRQAQQDAQGQVQGTASSMMALGWVAGPWLGGLLFSASIVPAATEMARASPFLVLAGLVGLAILVSMLSLGRRVEPRRFSPSTLDPSG